MVGQDVTEGGSVQRIWACRVIPALLVVVLIAHGGAIRNGFLYDDYHLIAENPGVTTHAWEEIWTSTDAASRDAEGRGFRPATLSSYAIDHLVGGGRPAVYHATQVALHAGVVALFYLVAIMLGIAPWWAAVGALMVGLHPLQTEAVQYLSARSSVLSTLALLAAFWMYLRWRNQPTGQHAWRMASLVCLALAVLSKESAVVGVAWFVAYERLIKGATWAETARRLSLHAGIVVVTVVPAIVVLRVGTPPASISPETAMATGVAVLGRHLWSWFAPLNIHPISPHPWVGWGQPAVWGGVFVIAGIGLAAYALRRRIPLASWGLVCGVSALLPVLALPFVTNVAFFQPHRGYPSAVGLAMAMVAVATAGERRGRGVVRSDTLRLAVWSVAGIVTIAAVVADARAGRLWRDEVGFWTDAVGRYPNEGAYHQSLGAARFRGGDLSGAQAALASAARLDPLLPRVDFNLGVVYTKLGRYGEAIDAYERAVARDSTDVKSFVNLGLLYERTGDPLRAIRAYTRALTIDPHLVPIRHNLARLSMGRTGEPAAPEPLAAGR